MFAFMSNTKKSFTVLKTTKFHDGCSGKSFASEHETTIMYTTLSFNNLYNKCFLEAITQGFQSSDLSFEASSYFPNGTFSLQLGSLCIRVLVATPIIYTTCNMCINSVNGFKFKTISGKYTRCEITLLKQCQPLIR